MLRQQGERGLVAPRRATERHEGLVDNDDALGAADQGVQVLQAHAVARGRIGVDDDGDGGIGGGVVMGEHVSPGGAGGAVVLFVRGDIRPRLERPLGKGAHDQVDELRRAVAEEQLLLRPVREDREGRERGGVVGGGVVVHGGEGRGGGREGGGGRAEGIGGDGEVAHKVGAGGPGLPAVHLLRRRVPGGIHGGSRGVRGRV